MGAVAVASVLEAPSFIEGDLDIMLSISGFMLSLGRSALGPEAAFLRKYCIRVALHIKGFVE